MYTEEHLQQHDDAFSDEQISVSMTSSYDSDIFQEKLEIELNKREDKGYRKEKSKMEDGTFFKIESYCTPYTLGGQIRHAISGKRSRCKVGSKDENLFFVVTDTTYNAENPRKLFYNSPEEFERHYRVSLPTEVKLAYLQKKR